MHTRTISVPSNDCVTAFRSTLSCDAILALLNHRNYAQSLYAQLPIPNNKDEAWRFTHLSDIAWHTLSMHAINVSHIDLGDGVLLMDIRDFIRLYPQHAERYLFSQKNTQWKKHIFNVLVEACWNKGVVLFVPRNLVVQQVIDLNVIAHYAAPLSLEKVVIIVEPGASVTIKDIADQKTQSTVIVRAVDLFIGEYAQLTILHDQDYSRDVQTISHVRFYLERESQLHYCPVITGGYSTTLCLEVILCGERAQADIRGLYALHKNQHVAITTLQEHHAAHAQSDLLIKGALGDYARAVYKGNIFVHQQAKQTHATQQNKNILLSSLARAYSIPGLEVLTNDVRCMHGSAIGQLNAELLLYMQSRGLSIKKAKQLLLSSFFADALHYVSDDNVRRNIISRISRRLLHDK